MSMDRIGGGVTGEVGVGSTWSGGGVELWWSLGDPQPVFDLVEVGEEWLEEWNETVGREDTVEIEEA